MAYKKINLQSPHADQIYKIFDLYDLIAIQLLELLLPAL
jgi:hypothetical protein